MCKDKTSLDLDSFPDKLDFPLSLVRRENVWALKKPLVMLSLVCILGSENSQKVQRRVGVWG